MGTTSSPWRRRALLITLVGAVSVLMILAAALLYSTSDDAPGPGWVRVGTIQEVRAEGVVFIADVPAYVVIDPPRTPIAFLARSPHLGERIVYCTSSSMWFEDPAHGDKFDRLGNYVLGPAPRGLDRLTTLVQDGVVWVNPTEVALGPPRGPHDFKPAGPFCSGMD